ncbi:MAG: methyltransferase domain containing protein [Candidatus Omnitrophica bacterium]|nr:methyltransferase domain containing protein [Candidatus Omnitrophota bacterium]
MKNRIYRTLHPRAPWLTPAAIKFLRAYLRAGMAGFEWGSGKSTLFFAQRVKSVISVEHSGEWYARVKAQLRQAGLMSKVKYQLIPPNPREDFAERSSENPEDAVCLAAMQKKEFYAYARKITAYPDDHFDFILVDGRARVGCMCFARKKVKRGGVLVLDNAERQRYQPAFGYFNGWTKTETSNGLWHTTIWKRDN